MPFDLMNGQRHVILTNFRLPAIDRARRREGSMGQAIVSSRHRYRLR